jgi:hypothetical protein
VRTTRPSKKLDWLHGKYEVIREVNSHAYELKVPGRIHAVFHVDLLRPAPKDPLPSQRTDDSQPQPILIDGEEEWLVERILDERWNNLSGTRYKEALVKWIGYGEPTWEPISNLRDTEQWKLWRKYKQRTSPDNS